ncbi:MAG: hypothetical protein LBE12_11065 [Planctomycetaceae bacterium]|jgi:hypothetical protein|nr:hypothetical protein [Planctomycetaceae bacterium]
MSQQFEYSLDIQGNSEPYLSEFSLVAVPTTQEPDSPVICPVKPKLKKKRGRPRKALPLNILSPNFSRQPVSCQTGWNTDKPVAEKTTIISNSVADVPRTANHHVDFAGKNWVVDQNLLCDNKQKDQNDRNNQNEQNNLNEHGLQDLELAGSKLPFFDDELATLDEFEKLSQPIEGNLSGLYDFKRVDKPAAISTPLPSSPELLKQKKNGRRRQIDPSTCERDYSHDEVEFMNALNDYKQTSGRMFPTCSEILEVLKSLGYEKRNPEADNVWNTTPQNSNMDCLQLKN